MVNIAIGNEPTAIKFGLVFRKNNKLYLGDKEIRSNEDRYILTESVAVPGTDAREVWELLIAKTLPKKLEYSSNAIYSYLTLLHGSNIRIPIGTNKAKVLGDYVREYREYLEVEDTGIKDDLKYYGSIVQTDYQQKKQTTKQKKSKKGEGFKVNDNSDLAQ